MLTRFCFHCISPPHIAIVKTFLDVALQIAKKYPELASGNVLLLLARKPSVFSETKSNITERNISGKHLYSMIYIIHQ